MNKSIEDRLDKLNKEELIWIIYLIIIILSFYSNNLERDYFINNNDDSKDKYRNISILIFVIAIIIYIYFVYDSYQDIKKNNGYDKERNDLLDLNLIASILILISGIILLYIAIRNDDLGIEIAFV